MLISAAKSGTKKAGWIISEHGISAQPSGGRQRRVVLPGGPHHITQRGNNRRDVVFEDSDRELYLCLLREHAAKYQVEILGYCLMTNHVHLIAIPADATGLAKTIGRVHNDYARWLHIRRRESGHL